MRNTAKNRLINLIRKKLSDRRGFSLGELLAATVILLLTSQVMTQGMAFATRMYNESMTRSHAKQLCSTFTNKSFLIEKELVKKPRRIVDEEKEEIEEKVEVKKEPEVKKIELTEEEIEALKELAKNSAKFLSLLKSKEDEKEELEEKELDKDVEEKIEEKEEVKKEINEEDTDASDEDDEDIEEEKEEEEVSEEEVIDVDSVDDSDSIVEDTMKKSFGSIESKKCPTGDSVENDEQALANIWAQRYKSK